MLTLCLWFCLLQWAVHSVQERPRGKAVRLWWQNNVIWNQQLWIFLVGFGFFFFKSESRNLEQNGGKKHSPPWRLISMCFETNSWYECIVSASAHWIFFWSDQTGMGAGWVSLLGMLLFKLHIYEEKYWQLAVFYSTDSHWLLTKGCVKIVGLTKAI